MAGDEFKKVKPGEPMRLSASTFNTMIDTMQAERNRAFSGGAGGARSEGQPNWVLVRNDSGQHVPFGGCLGLSGPLFSPSVNPSGFQEGVRLAGVVPQRQHDGRFAIAAEPIAAGAVGRAYVSGACVARVHVAGPAPRYADVMTGDVTQLISQESGAARILAVEDGTGDGKWAYIDIGETNSPQIGTIVSGTAPVYRVHLLVANVDVDAVLIPSASTLQVGSYVGVVPESFGVMTSWGWPLQMTDEAAGAPTRLCVISAKVGTRLYNVLAVVGGQAYLNVTIHTEKDLPVGAFVAVLWEPLAGSYWGWPVDDTVYAYMGQVVAKTGEHDYTVRDLLAGGLPERTHVEIRTVEDVPVNEYVAVLQCTLASGETYSWGWLMEDRQAFLGRIEVAVAGNLAAVARATSTEDAASPTFETYPSVFDVVVRTSEDLYHKNIWCIPLRGLNGTRKWLGVLAEQAEHKNLVRLGVVLSGSGGTYTVELYEQKDGSPIQLGNVAIYVGVNLEAGTHVAVVGGANAGGQEGYWGWPIDWWDAAYRCQS